jgi:hypothetical protein
MKKKTDEQKQYDRIDKIFTDAREDAQNRHERVQSKRAEVEAIVNEQRRMKWNLIAYALILATAGGALIAAWTAWGRSDYQLATDTEPFRPEAGEHIPSRG